MKNIIKSIYYRFRPAVVINENESRKISIETALNSRCNSSGNSNQKKYHWGIFDDEKKLTVKQIEKIFSYAETNEFENRKNSILIKQRTCKFTIPDLQERHGRERLMIENGMQQQAVSLACAALGIGMVYQNLGINGKRLSDSNWGTVKIKVGAMKPSYSGSFWCDNIPEEFSPKWKKGNLPDPVRKGNKPMLTALQKAKRKNAGSSEITDAVISQLLWAARGRTPHFYNSRPWGLTIPTWGGKQHISDVYYIYKNKVYKYINWEDNKPTHKLKEIKALKNEDYDNLKNSIQMRHRAIVLNRNEMSERALWEIGYQLQNLILQGFSLGVNYDAQVLKIKQQNQVTDITGLKNPIGLFLI